MATVAEEMTEILQRNGRKGKEGLLLPGMKLSKSQEESLREDWAGPGCLQSKGLVPGLLRGWH